MSNELITIEEKSLLSAFSEPDGLDAVIAQAKELVEGFEHDLSTDAGRKRTASLAHKVAKLKTKMDGLGKSLTEDWAKKKKAVDANRKQMRDELDELKKVARKPLDDWEAEQAEIERQRKLEEERKQREADHEIALFLNEKFDAERQAAIEAERKAEEERLARLKAEQEERDRRIAEEARKAAEAEAAAKAERERQEAAEREATAKAEAEAAKQRAIEAEARAKVEAEQAEKARIEAEKQAKIQAEKAAEQARLDEIARQEAEAKRIAAEKAAREANRRHIGEVRKAAKEALMKFVDEETAKKIVLAINNGDVPNVTINY